MTAWVVEIAAGVWLAPWLGDPGRTMRFELAKRYTTERGAKIALGLARRARALRRARVVEVKE